MSKIIILLFFVFSNTTCFSQINTIESFLDDRGRTEAKDIVKTNISEILQANIPIIWEHRFTENVAVQAGVGLLTHNLFKPIIRPSAKRYPLYDKIEGGFSLYVHPMYYFRNLESTHSGISLQYSRHGNQASSIEYALCLGKQWFLERHFAVDVELDIGTNLEYSLDGQSYIFNPDILDEKLANKFRSRSIIMLSLKLGYIL